MFKTVLKKWILRVIGPMILLMLLFRIDMEATAKVLCQVSLEPVLLAYLMFIPSLFFRNIRWRLLMASQRIHLEFYESFNIYAISILVGTLTPGRIGELIKALYLKQKGNSFGTSFFSVFMDRIYDILFLALFGCGAIAWFVLFGERTAAVILWIFLAIGVVVLLLWGMAGNRGKEWVVNALRRMAPEAAKDRVATNYLDFSAGFGKRKPVMLVWGAFLTCLAWGSNYGAVYLFSFALGFDIPFLAVAGIAAICALVTMIPISVLGLGTRDAVLILILARYGITESSAMAFSALILSMLLSNAVLCSFSLLTPAGRFNWRLKGGKV